MNDLIVKSSYGMMQGCPMVQMGLVYLRKHNIKGPTQTPQVLYANCGPLFFSD